MRIVFVALFFLMSCSITSPTPADFQEKILAVAPGMTPKEVNSLLGPPGNKQFGGDSREAWTYFFLGKYSDDYHVVFFDRDVVRALSYYSGEDYVGPARYRQIDFRDSPETRTEHTIRYR
jgi:hypothetical protein